VKNAIVKLMVATMVVDGKLFIDEFNVIKGAIGILGVDDKEYDALINESKELSDFGSVLNWSRPALDTLRALNDPAVSSVAIANMVLVAYADGKIQSVENDFIQYSASYLDVAGPTLKDEQKETRERGD